jgi:hypothetical protein
VKFKKDCKKKSVHVQDRHNSSPNSFYVCLFESTKVEPVDTEGPMYR